MATSQIEEEIIRIAAQNLDEGDSNTLRIYRELDFQMMTAHRGGDAESRLDGERIARILLAYPDLPLAIRARACMVVGCGVEADFVAWAEEGVRIAQLGMRLALAAPPEAGGVGEFETQLLEDTEQVLREARAAKARIDQRQAGDEAEGSTRKRSAQVEVVLRNVEKKMKKRVRRVHSGDTSKGPHDYEEFDLDLDRWVRLGTATKPQFIETDPDDDELLDNPPFSAPLAPFLEGADDDEMLFKDPGVDEGMGDDEILIENPGVDEGMGDNDRI